MSELQANWDAHGKIDPLWAIATCPGKKGGRWDVKEFFETGRNEVARVKGKAASLGMGIGGGRAMDFGCGVGRVTQHLCQYFDECYGVDIAPSMIRLANKYNRHGKRCKYVVNSRSDLSLFKDDSFDLVYSMIALQHVPPQYTRTYLREFVRVLKPGGLLFFQLPSELGEKGSKSLSALLEEGFKAGIKLGDVPESMEAGAPATISVTVTNLSEVAWPSSEGAAVQAIQVGNHWFKPSGEVLVADDGRTPLLKALEPGESTVLRLAIEGPLNPGEYVLEVDMVQEGIAWFKERGSEPGRAQISIIRQRKGRGVGRVAEGDFGLIRLLRHALLRCLQRACKLLGDMPQPKIEAFGIPAAEVLALLKEAGGKVIDVEFDTTAAPGWRSGIYSVTK